MPEDDLRAAIKLKEEYIRGLREARDLRAGGARSSGSIPPREGGSSRA